MFLRIKVIKLTYLCKRVKSSKIKIKIKLRFLFRQISLLIIIKSSLAMITTRQQFIQKDAQYRLNAKCFNKDSLSPTSTDASQSPRDHCDTLPKPYHDRSHHCKQDNKQKSQLCKKFMECGFCPYKKKCKFAHGSHELRKNSQLNSKYKTKECGVFVNDGHCPFGDRCNFIHCKKFESEKTDPLDLIDLGFLEVKAGLRTQSRLITLLQ